MKAGKGLGKPFKHCVLSVCYLVYLIAIKF